MKNPKISIAVIIPCFNEAQTIDSVVKKFRKFLPESKIYVYDNNSTDGTARIAKKSGAIVRLVKKQGKGSVVRRMFSDIEADIYVMVDGDDTYEIEKASNLVDYLIENQLDMLIGSRIHNDKKAYRFGHQFGNNLITKTINFIFDNNFKDILSGYRVFTRRFVKTFPALSNGFEIETELNIYALELNIQTEEIQTKYFSRPEGSVSKLSSFKDGFKILLMIIRLFKEKKPFIFFSIGSFISTFISLLLFIPVLNEFMITGTVPRFPTAFLSVSLIIISLIFIVCGIILEEISKNRKNNNYLKFLSHPRNEINLQK
jgi:glycosyltransferase involved in cell wall biosynthesis